MLQGKKSFTKKERKEERKNEKNRKKEKMEGMKVGRKREEGRKEWMDGIRI